MRWSKHPIPALALAALLAAGSALTPDVAAAQGNSHKNKADKQLAKQARREARAVRYEDRRDDDRWDGRWDDRDRDRDGRRRRYANVPPGHMPPAGLCRIWIDGVPPGRQPRPTDCATAERYRPANARVIYGADARRARYDGDVWRRDRDGVWRRGSDGVWRDERGRTRAEVLRGDRTDGGSCLDVNRDGRCDF